jgi:hypothetical protein
LAWSGCGTTVIERQKDQPVTDATEETKGEPERIGKYYLDDVHIPEVLNYKLNKSFVYENSKFKAGFFTFYKMAARYTVFDRFFYFPSIFQNLIKHEVSGSKRHG